MALAKLVIMKKGGEPGEVAINPDLVTHVRSSSGPFTDIYFGEHRVAVEGSFAQVTSRLNGFDDFDLEPPAPRTWLSSR
ncbi:MAG TPA: hypothetical protein VGW34_12305 [Allosphingosinicella sp.]|nr:hypothetical protein [Allosphingosinicella sp.]